MTWWMLGTGSPAAAGTVADDAPSLWSGGVRWGDAAPFGDGTDAYWGSDVVATGRTGKPRLSVAIGGGLVRNQLMSADWTLGRDGWLSTLSPTSSSLSFVDVPIAHINDTIVIGLMSDTEEYHSDALWVGRVTDIETRRDVGSGKVYSTISATDVIGTLGKAKAPTSIVAGYTLKTLVERLALDAGVALTVETDQLATLPTLNAATDIDGSVLDLINRAERSSNALLFLRGSGRLYAAMRDTTGASAVEVIELDGADSPGGWTERTSLGEVVTRWRLGAGDAWSTDTIATTLDEYGDQTFSAEDLLITDPAPYAAIIASDVMANPRPLVVDAPFPVRDLAQNVLYLDPLDRVENDGLVWQVMSVSHNVGPAEWRMGITADATQEALAGAPDPGPVTPPALDTVTLTYTATKGATASLTSGGTGGGTGTGALLVGRSASGTTYRSSIEWAISWPMNTIRVVSASIRLVTNEASDDPRIRVRRHDESWTEGAMTWPGPTTTDPGQRYVDIPKAADKATHISITAIAEEWRTKGNDGLALRSVNESNKERRASFYSDDAADPAKAPILTLVVEVVS